MENKAIVIGITGTIAAGKGAAQFFLVNRGFKHIRLTDPIFDRMKDENLDPSDRSNWVKMDTKFRKDKGLEFLAEIASEKIDEGEKYVICPLRHPADIKFLKEKFDAKIIYIDAPLEDRFKRTYYKEIPGKMTLEEFKKRDDFENNPTGPDKKYLTNMKECKELSDFVVENKGSLNDLSSELEKVMRAVGIPESQDQSIYEDFDM